MGGCTSKCPGCTSKSATVTPGIATQTSQTLLAEEDPARAAVNDSPKKEEAKKDESFGSMQQVGQKAARAAKGAIERDSVEKSPKGSLDESSGQRGAAGARAEASGSKAEGIEAQGTQWLLAEEDPARAAVNEPAKTEEAKKASPALLNSNTCAGLVLIGLVLVGLVLIAMSRPWQQQQAPAAVQAAPPPVDPPRTLEQPGPEIGECTFWGDPHLKSFDGGRPSFYGEGEFYLVKTPTINIQGRYLGTKYTAGLAATNKIVVGGAFLKGHTVAVGDLEDGPIRVDGVPVPALRHIPSNFDLYHLGNISYSSEGRLVDQATGDWEQRVVKMELPERVVIEVFRWTNYIDLRITMPPQKGQDGSCGNFNMDPSDDTDEAVFNRIGARIPEGQLLFNERADERLTSTEEDLIAECDSHTLALAKIECDRDLAMSYKNASLLIRQSCWLDICYGPDQHTLRLAKRLEKKLAEPGAQGAAAPQPGFVAD